MLLLAVIVFLYCSELSVSILEEVALSQSTFYFLSFLLTLFLCAHITFMPVHSRVMLNLLMQESFAVSNWLCSVPPLRSLMIFLLLISDVMQLFSLSLTQNICASQPCTLQKTKQNV